MRKLYCYVDESGQHTLGAYFLVSVVIAEQDRDQLETWLLSLEQSTGKRHLKWNKSKHDIRLAYIRGVLKNPDFKGKIFTSYAENSLDYVGLTVTATAQSIDAYTDEDYRATVIVDGLKKAERNRFSTGLRGQGITTGKVIGRNDEKEPLIRLADAVCGFVADAMQGSQTYKYLLDKALQEGFLKLL